MSSTNKNAFAKTVTSLIEYCRDSFKDMAKNGVPNAEEAHKKAKVVLIKAETAIDLGLDAFCQEFVKKLSPHVAAITTRDDSFIHDVLPTMKVLKDMNITGVWSSCPKEFQDQVWNRLNTAYMLASAAVNTEIASAAAKGSGVSPDSINPDELGQVMQNIMPGMMNMLGPMMQNLAGGGRGGNKQMKKKLARDAANPNSPLQQMAQGMLGINLPQKDQENEQQTSNSNDKGKQRTARRDLI
jgi:hypothetical protein